MAEVYPEIIDSHEEDYREPACSAVEALTRQEPFINQNLACGAMAMLAQLLRHGSLAFIRVNLQAARTGRQQTSKKESL